VSALLGSVKQVELAFLEVVSLASSRKALYNASALKQS
jgi:hypothetical protein